MSCYESERGGWDFPTKNWSKVRQDLIDAEFKVREDEFKVLTKLWELSKSMGAKAFNDDFDKLFDQAKKDVFGKRYDSWRREYVVKDNAINYWSLKDKIEYGTSGKMKKPVKPKKRKKEDSMSFSFDCAYLSLDFTRRRIDWSVDENNRAVDTSWGHPMGQALNGILKRTNFTGSTGGYTIYRSEYQEDYEPSYNNVYGKKVKERLWGR